MLADPEDEDDHGDQNSEAPTCLVHPVPAFQEISQTQSGAEIVGENGEPTHQRRIADLQAANEVIARARASVENQQPGAQAQPPTSNMFMFLKYPAVA